MTPLVLILGGTSEASGLARLLGGDERFRAVLSLAGVTRAPAPSPLPRRTGGFGGAAGLARYLREHKVAALVDATHPFAVRMGANAVEAASAACVPLLRLTRPEWRPGPDDRWRLVATTEDAAAALPRRPATVLLTIGRNDLAPFGANPAGHRVIVRSVDAPPEALLPAGARAVEARGPFGFEEELAFFRREAIDVLVTKNAGGDATRAKLDAARWLGVAVIMVRRPPRAEAPSTETDPGRARDWLVHACLGA